MNKTINGLTEISSYINQDYLPIWHSNKTYKISLANIFNGIMAAVDPEGLRTDLLAHIANASIHHTHTNKGMLDGLSDNNGVLNYMGNPVGSGGTAGLESPVFTGTVYGDMLRFTSGLFVGAGVTSGNVLSVRGDNITSGSILKLATGSLTGADLFSIVGEGATYSGNFLNVVSNAISLMSLSGTGVLSLIKDINLGGITIGQGTGAGIDNIIFGKSALASRTTGTNNVAIGNYAGNALTVGARNIAIGNNAFKYSSVAKNDNIAIGDATLSGILSGGVLNSGYSKCIAIGTSALTALKSNSLGNIALGYNAIMSAVYYTNNNIAIGTDSLKTATQPVGNIAIGTSALLAYTMGGNYGNNIAIGTEVARDKVTGYGNTYIGYRAGLAGHSMYSIALGNNALSNNDGTYTIAIGEDSGNYYGSADDETYGEGPLVQSNNSIFIGTSTRAQMDQSTNEIVIGYQAKGAGSNTVTLGSSAITALKVGNTLVTTDQLNSLTSGGEKLNKLNPVAIDTLTIQPLEVFEPTGTIVLGTIDIFFNAIGTGTNFTQVFTLGDTILVTWPAGYGNTGKMSFIVRTIGSDTLISLQFVDETLIGQNIPESCVYEKQLTKIPVKKIETTKESITLKETSLTNITTEASVKFQDNNLELAAPSMSLKIAGATITSNELTALDGVTSSIQTQLNNKPSGEVLSSDTFIRNRMVNEIGSLGFFSDTLPGDGSQAQTYMYTYDNSIDIGTNALGTGLDGSAYINMRPSVMSTSVDDGVSNSCNMVLDAVNGFQISGSSINNIPLSPTSDGKAGSIRISDSYLYICTAQNQWKRALLSEGWVGITVNIIGQHKGTATTPGGFGGITPGENKTITVTPDTGYYISTLSAPGLTYTPSYNPFTFDILNIQTNIIIAIIFSGIPLPITKTQTSGGVISQVPVSAPLWGSSPIIRVKPNSGYKIESITLDGVVQTLPVDPVIYPNKHEITLVNISTTHTVTATYSLI
jgi:hypothetical protein